MGRAGALRLLAEVQQSSGVALVALDSHGKGSQGDDLAGELGGCQDEGAEKGDDGNPWKSRGPPRSAPHRGWHSQPLLSHPPPL